MIKKSLRPALVTAMLCAATSLPAQQPSPEDVQFLRKEVETLRAEQETIQKDLQEIRKLLQAKPANRHQAMGATVSVDGKPYKGRVDAQVTIIEFSDYQCPFSARHERDTLAQIQKQYIDTGKLKYVFGDLPLQFHPHAAKFAEAAHCAGEQGKYWEMHDHIFANQKGLNPSNLVAHATAVGLDVPKFQDCLAGGKFAALPGKQGAEANKLGLTGTPSFVLGLTQPNEPTIKVLKVIVGAQKIAAFQEAIDSVLAAAPKAAPHP